MSTYYNTKHEHSCRPRGSKIKNKLGVLVTISLMLESNLESKFSHDFRLKLICP